MLRNCACRAASCAGKQFQRLRGGAADGQIHGKASHRVTDEQRVCRHVNQLGAWQRVHPARPPRYFAVDDQYGIGTGEHLVGVDSKKQRVGGGNVELPRSGLARHDHADPVMLGNFGQAADVGGIPAAAGTHDERKFGLAQPLGGLLHGHQRWRRRQGTQGTLPRRGNGLVGQVTEHFTGHAQVHRPLRFAHGHVERAADDFVRCLAGTQFVVPFHPFPHDTALVEAVLTPVDRGIA